MIVVLEDPVQAKNMLKYRCQWLALGVQGSSQIVRVVYDLRSSIDVIGVWSDTQGCRICIHIRARGVCVQLGGSTCSRCE
ncbi:hypothetical protein M404DRAFT_1002569 [Pisolithus tinctorius Marx 270]|uniref:Uncharacterized protein n=1 Tax=Pisolithus tinctorius Marx 270 TaxID=870435 RepID=A0A0C3JXK1_PISTI|nr:hypothetical protein M404DRAFT_1002569 [Pisolithus tinctorius Marx 270]